MNYPWVAHRSYYASCLVPHNLNLDTLHNEHDIFFHSISLCHWLNGGIKCLQSAQLQQLARIPINFISKDKDCIKMPSQSSVAIHCHCSAQAPHLQPKNIHGWFWSGSGARIPATNVTAPGWKSNPWSHTGYLSQVTRTTDH